MSNLTRHGDTKTMVPTRVVQKVGFSGCSMFRDAFIAGSLNSANIREDPMGRWAVGPLVGMFTDGDCVGMVCHAMLWYCCFLVT